MNIQVWTQRAAIAVAFGGLLSVISGGASGCTSNTIHVGDESADGGGTFSRETDSGAAPDAAELLTCIGTECPPGYDTCLSGWVGAATYKCGTDLMRDDDNCGACGNECPTYLPLHMRSVCVDGVCQQQCYVPPGPFHDWKNCNDLIDDGCETDVFVDTNNCGLCGHACADGEPCIEGRCGCPEGKIACRGKCIDPLYDDSNCGGCGNSCFLAEIPDRCTPPPHDTYYGCVEGVCGKLKCFGNAGDCDNDIPTLKCASNGCEVRNIWDDHENCGGCGIRCRPEEECIAESGQVPYCGIRCAKYNKTNCSYECVDLLNDVRACGSCGNICPLGGPNHRRSCQKGLCVLECIEGFADCNEDPTDGCEVNLRAHPENCGTCGNECNMDADQPCVDGRCLTVDCGTPGAR